jgi:hypothetical protein
MPGPVKVAVAAATVAVVEAKTAAAASVPIASQLAQSGAR